MGLKPYESNHQILIEDEFNTIESASNRKVKFKQTEPKIE